MSSRSRPDGSEGPAGAAYSDPYICGVALGLVLLGAFAWTGRGLGASGAFGSVAAAVTKSGAPYFARFGGEPPWRDWLVWEIVGVVIGAFVSAWLAGRLRASIDRGPNARDGERMASAVGGGTLMGVGAVLARGCTSGLALSGAAMLSVGAWLFMIAAFAAGFGVAPFARRLWR